MATTPRVRVSWLIALGCLTATAAAAQDAGHAHVGHVARAFAGTPGGQGLLPMAVAEAEVARQHAELASRARYDLAAAKRHVGHVLHAIDPAVAPVGPGYGYGVRRAAEGVAEHIELAAAAEGASDNLRTHARHIAGAARSVAARSDRIVALGERIRAVTSATAMTPALQELEALTRALFFGVDVDGDERVGWAEPEGGLRQAQQHMTLLERGEGLVPTQR